MTPGILARLFAMEPDANVQWGPNPYPQQNYGVPRLSEMYGPNPSGFVDRIEDGKTAVILGPHGEEYHTDPNRLPQGADEGSWVRDREMVPPPPSRGDEIRRRLSAGDNGGRIRL